MGLLLKQGERLEKKNLDSALFYYNKALLFKENISDTLLARVYSRLGAVYLLKGNHDICLDYQFKALNIYEEYPVSLDVLKVYNIIGLVYFYQDNFDKALLHFNKVNGYLDKKIGSDTLKVYAFKGKLLNNIGIIYDNKNQLDTALEYFTQASTYSKKVNDVQNLSSVYSNMGLIYLKSRRFELAEATFVEALRIRQKENNVYGLCKSYYHLGLLYKDKELLDKALENFLISLKYCRIANASSAREEVLKELSIVMARKENYQQAYQYHIAYKALSDSLFNKENHQKMIQSEMQYQFDKKNQIAKASQDQRELLFISIAVVLFLGIIIVIIMYRLQGSKAKIQQLAKERAELSNKEFTLREYTLKRELEFKNKELTTNIIYLLKKNELIVEISDRLMALKKQVKKEDQEFIKKIIFDIKNAQDEDVWKEFEVRFNLVYNDFYERLKEKYPDLTTNEKRICGFLRLNMTSKEICSLTRQSYNSLNVARARLRKKLNIQNEEVSLINFLESI
ncbi:tetratricopeptide repeat protein [Flavobacterium sp. RSSA_27]|uniref:tetratricopeptide repeat protein n=1 Tax=Flavobacterium sp. RSSA_27 TaxID=3447667 RepID=UPI003F3FA871